MAKKISNDDTFENYIGKFIQVNVNGTIKKYYVSNIDSNSFVTQAGILKNYSVIGESAKQECDVCEDVCYRNIPVIKVIFSNTIDLTDTPGVNPYTKAYAEETHELFLNGTSLGQINIGNQRSEHNELWFVPYDATKINVTNTYASSANSSKEYTFFHGDISSLVLSTYNSNLFNKNDYNEICIKPIQANNPLNNTGFYYTNPSNSFFSIPTITLDIHKIFPETTNTSSISCEGYTMYNFSELESGQQHSYSLQGEILDTSLRFTNTGYSLYNSYRPLLKQYLSAGSTYQEFSASFYYLDPCSIDSPAYYSLNPQYYYSYDVDVNGDPINTEDYRFAYGWTGFAGSQVFYPENNPPNPLLKKMIFFNSPNLNDRVEVFIGAYTKDRLNFQITSIDDDYNTRSPFLYSTLAGSPGFLSENDTAIYNSKFGNELFTGTLYVREDKTHVGGTVRFRQLSVYTDSSLATITQNVSVGGVF